MTSKETPITLEVGRTYELNNGDISITGISEKSSRLDTGKLICLL